MAALARLRAPLDAFFDKVTVNAPEPDLRRNRLRLFIPSAGDHGPGRRFFAYRRLKRFAMSKWVYSFGAGHNEGGADMKNLLGGKGANLAEMAGSACPSRPASPSPPRSAPRSTRTTGNYPNDLQRAGARRAGAAGEGAGPEVRRQAQAAAGLGALRRAGVHAGHDGHRAQPRPERRDGGGPRRRGGRSALCLGFLSPLHPDVRLRRARRRPPSVRGDHRAHQARHRRHRGHPAYRAGLAARGRRPTRT